MPLRSVNPATLEVLGQFEELTAPQIEQKLSLADKAYKDWRTTTFAQRAKLMHAAAAYLRSNKDRYAEIASHEVGKTLTAAAAEVEKSALACDYYADNAEKFLSPEAVATDAAESYVRFDPIGPVLAVMPWNFPYWQVFRFAAPALMAGNVGLLKHASNVQLSAQAIEEVFTGSGFPKGAFLNLAIGSAKVEAVIRDPRVKAVTLTGSEYAGSQVAKQAGEEIKKTVLELGGSDPFIVLEGADVDAAVAASVLGRMQANAGQSCIAAKRFIVHASLEKEFTGTLKAAVQKLVVGDPLAKQTDVGPLATEQILTDIEKQVNDSVSQGATVVFGAKRPERLSGYYYTPTILSGVTDRMPVFAEEVFGPVFPVVSFDTDDQAVSIANDSLYGLGATIFSSDVPRAKLLAARIESGSVFINGPVKSDPRLPFGGVKKSGYGRELSDYGIREFVNIKTVWVK